MSITLHCEHCGKKIEAADSAAGKWGKCPSCHNRVYVPDLNIDEDLKLTPIDESDLERQKRLMAETFKLSQDILLEKEEAANINSASKITEQELNKNIIKYFRQMADGRLDQAKGTAELIAPHGKKALKILDRIALSGIPEPELADIPSQVLSGMIRNLRAEIS